MTSRMPAPLLVVLVALALAALAAASAPDTARAQGVVAPGAEFVPIATGYHFTEGPAPLPDGGLVFTDVFDPDDASYEGAIHVWSPDEGARLYREPTNRTNGLGRLPDGRIVGCEWFGRRVVADDLAGNVSVLAETYDGGRLNGPNDVWIAPGGGLYFTDPVFGEPPGEKEQDGQYVYYLPPGGGELVRASDGLQYPNGLVGTPDGRLLYVTDSAQPTWRYEIDTDGTLTGKELFTMRGGDGMAVDAEGHVYLASQYDIYVYDPEGDLVETIRPPEPPSNMAFGGEDGTTLFVTAGTSVYTLRMAVPGAGWPPGSDTPEPPTETLTPEPPDIVPPGAEPRRLTTGYTFTEGPAVDRSGDLYFTDVPQSTTYRLQPDGFVDLYRDNTGRGNGLYFDDAWNLVTCEGGAKRVTRDDRAGTVTPLTDGYGDRPLNAPNDLWIAPDGGIYFTDPLFVEPGPTNQGVSRVYYLPPGTSGDGEITAVIEDLVLPNGVIGTPDGAVLFVSDYAGQIWRYEIQSDGSVDNATLVSDWPGDGMTLDERGNLYVASGAQVRIFAPDGEEIEEIVPPEAPSNVTFGGPAGRTLYITARTSVYAIDLNVRGAYAPDVPVTPTATGQATATFTPEPSETAATPTDIPTATPEAPGTVLFVPFAER